MIYTDYEYIAAINKITREADKDQGYMLTKEFKAISAAIEQYEDYVEFQSRSPEHIVLAIFDKIGVKLTPDKLFYNGY